MVLSLVLAVAGLRVFFGVFVILSNLRYQISIANPNIDRFCFNRKREDSNTFEKVTYIDLIVGDFIRLKKNDVCPVNLLIVDGKGMECDKGIFVVDKFRKNEKNQLEKKSSIEKLRSKKELKDSQAIKKYIYGLNFSLEIESKEFNENFAGILRIKKDPKQEEIRFKNIIEEESIVKSQWVMGIVLDKRNHMKKIIKNNFKQGRIIEHQVKKLKKILFCIVFSLAVILIHVRLTAEFFEIEEFLQAICKFISLFPIGLDLFLDIVFFVQSQKANRKLEQISCKIAKNTVCPLNADFPSYFKVLNPKSISNLNNLEYAIFTKNDQIVERSKVIKSVCTKNKFYNIKYGNDNKLQDYHIEEHSIGSISSEEEDAKNNNDQTDQSEQAFNKRSSDLKRLSTIIKNNSYKFNKLPSINVNGSEMIKKNSNMAKDDKKSYRRKSTYRKNSLLFKLITANSNTLNDPSKPSTDEFINPDLSNTFLNKLKASENTRLFNDLYKNWASNKTGKTSINPDVNIPESKSVFKKSQTGIFEYNNIRVHSKMNLSGPSKLDKFEIQVLNLLTSLIAVTNPFLFRKKNNKYTSENFIDNAIINLCEKFNLTVVNIKNVNRSKMINVGVNINGICRKYAIVNISGEKEEDGQYYYLIDEESDVMSLFYRCVDFKSCEKYIKNPEDIIVISKVVDKNDSKNLDTLIILEKKLNKEERKVFTTYFNKLNRNKVGYEQFLEKTAFLMKDIEFKMALGIKDKIKPIPLLISNLKEANVKFVYMTKGDYKEGFSVAKKFRMLRKEGNQIKMNFKTNEEGVIKFKELYKNFEQLFNNLCNNSETPSKRLYNFMNDHSLFTHHKFTIFISGCSIRLIAKDPYLFTNFKFLLTFAKEIICHNFESCDRLLLLEVLKFKNGKRKILAVGNSNKDFKLLERADVGVNLTKKTNNLFGDIISSKLDALNQFIFEDNIQFNDNILQFLNIVFFNTTLIMIVAFLDFFMFSFKSTRFTNNILLTDGIIFYVIFGPTFIFQEKNELLERMKDFKFLYQSYFNRSKNLFNSFIKEMIEAVYTACIIFGICRHFHSSPNQENEYPKESYFSISLILLIIIIIKIKHVVVTKNKNFIIISSFLFSIVVIIGIFYGRSYSDMDLMVKHTDFHEIFSNFSYYLLIFAFPLFLSSNFWFYDISFRRYSSNYILKFYELYRVRNIPELIFIYLADWFKGSKGIFFPALLIKFSKMKQHLDPFIVTISYPFDLLTKENLIKKFSLTFKNDFLEKAWNFKIVKNVNHIFMPFSFFVISLFLLNEAKTYLEKSNNIGIYNLAIFLLVYILIFLLNLRQILKNRLFTVINEVVFSLSALILFYDNPIFFMFNLIVHNHYFSIIGSMNFKTYFVIHILKLFMCMMVILYNSLIGETIKYDLNTKLASLFILTAFYFIQMMWFRHIEKLKRELFLIENRLKHTSSFNNELLTMLMPRFVLNRISYDVNECSIAENTGNICIMFVEICDFNSLIDGFKDNIVTFLDELFRDYDILCDKYGVQKIETVGKVYMASCGIKFVDERLPKKLKIVESSKRLLDLAITMMNLTRNFTINNGQPIKIKIGLHYGKCMMGVIGYHKPQFSLIGDTINTTSRLCGTGIPGNIMMSSEYFDMLIGYKFKKNMVIEKKFTEMKGKGKVLVYHLYTQKPNLRKKLVKALSNSFSKSIANSTQSRLNSIIKTKNEGIKFEVIEEYNAKININIEDENKDQKEKKHSLNPQNKINLTPFNNLKINDFHIGNNSPKSQVFNQKSFRSVTNRANGPNGKVLTYNKATRIVVDSYNSLSLTENNEELETEEDEYEVG